jgi:ribonuclease HI
VAQELWESIGIRGIIDEATPEDLSGSVVLESLLMRQDNTLPGMTSIGLKETIIVGCWYLWWMRRRRTHNEPVPPIHKCRMSILSITANAAKADSAPAEQCWTKPEVRQVKINVDGSFHQDVGAGAAGAVARDYEGRFIAASTVYLPNLASAAAAEAMAMREGLRLANRLGCNDIIAESDSLETVEACTGEERWWGESSATFADCVDLTYLIGKVQFKFCMREANGVAHELARFCFSSKSSCNWVDEPPRFLIDMLVKDVTKL